MHIFCTATKNRSMKALSKIYSGVEENPQDYHSIVVDPIVVAVSLFEITPKNLERQMELLGEFEALKHEIEELIDIMHPKFENELSDLIDLKSHVEIRIGRIEVLEFTDEQD